MAESLLPAWSHCGNSLSLFHDPALHDPRGDYLEQLVYPSRFCTNCIDLGSGSTSGLCQSGSSGPYETEAHSPAFDDHTTD